MLPYAGTPPRTWGHYPDPHRPSACGPVHPHARGDILCWFLVCAFQHGTPPRTWGHYIVADAFRISLRYTPTHVGTFVESCERLLARSVHPHARGDIRKPFIQDVLKFGTPPRTWGHCKRSPESCAGSRYTPTHVGTLLQALC